MNLLCVHDLVELHAEAEVRAEDASQQQAMESCLGRARFAVVRRVRSAEGEVALGIRGAGRNERYAAFANAADVVKVYKPWELRVAKAPKLAAYDALRILQERWAKLELLWGPVGSVGFALASGLESVTPTSDLDIAVQMDEALPLPMLGAMAQSIAGLACRVDAQLETERGGFVLLEVVSGVGRVLLRAPKDARLVENPWAALHMSVFPERQGVLL